MGYENGRIILNPIYVFEQDDEKSSMTKVVGSLKRTNNPLQNQLKLQLAGINAEI